MSERSPSLSRRVVATGSVACLGASLLLVGATSSSAAPAQVAAPTAAGGSLTPAPAAFGDDAGLLISAASTDGAKVTKVSDSILKIRLQGVEHTVRSTPATYTSITRKLGKGQVWNKLGKRPKGVLAGKRKSGSSTHVSVVFKKFRVANKKTGKVVIRAKVKDGTVPSIVKEELGLSSLNSHTFNANLEQATVVATERKSNMWQWSATNTGTGRHGATVQAEGDKVKVKFRRGKRATGIQPNNQGARASWYYIKKHFDDMVAQGKDPRLIVWGMRGKKVFQSVVLPDDLTANPRKVTISGKIAKARGNANGERREIEGHMKGMNVFLQTPSSGNNTGYTVIVGDSIASGEGGSMQWSYLSAGATGPAIRDPRAFCHFVDTTCVESEHTIPGDDSSPVTYKVDKGLAYEKGSYEKAATACHRGHWAPGTWLARYERLQSGMDADSINIACTGARTNHILADGYYGHRPQIEDLKDLASWLNVKNVVLTIGANDLRFGDIARGCFLAPVTKLLAAGGGDLTAAIGQASTVMAAMKYVNGDPKSWNPTLSESELCSSVNGPQFEKDVAALAEKVKNVLTRVHAAAPDAKVVNTTYPNLLPPHEAANWNRDGYWNQFIDGFAGPASGIPWTKNGDFGDAVLAGDPQAVDFATNDVFNPQGAQVGQALTQQFGLTFAADALPNGLILWWPDLEWASGSVEPQLNRAILKAGGMADPNKKWLQQVDMSGVFVGRQIGTAFNSRSGNIMSLNGDLGGDYGAAFREQRSYFVNSPLVGQTMPGGLCFEEKDVVGTGTGTCPGSTTDALHPNMLGQAAEGQCIVAVTTRPGTGDDISCVRRIGDGTAQPVPTDQVSATANYVPAPGDDTLCLTEPDKAISPIEKGGHPDCSSGGQADPMWDTKRWSSLKNPGTQAPTGNVPLP